MQDVARPPRPVLVMALMTIAVPSLVGAVPRGRRGPGAMSSIPLGVAMTLEVMSSMLPIATRRTKMLTMTTTWMEPEAPAMSLELPGVQPPRLLMIQLLPMVVATMGRPVKRTSRSMLPQLLTLMLKKQLMTATLRV